MSLTLDRIEIESVGADPIRLARALLEQLPELDGRVTIDEIALALDIVSIELAPLMSIEACLQCDARKSEGQIVVRANSSRQRRRYSIGHELGHFLNEGHRPMTPGGFACTRRDMAAPRGNARHLQQEREANTFAIEVLTPRRLLNRHLAPPADLEHAQGIAERFDISRAAAPRRYVDLHDECLAAIFSRDGQIVNVEKGEGFPRISVWTGDPSPGRPACQDEAPLTSLDEADAAAWLAWPDRYDLFAQTLVQEDGFATTLLVAECRENADEAPRDTPRFRR